MRLNPLTGSQKGEPDETGDLIVEKVNRVSDPASWLNEKISEIYLKLRQLKERWGSGEHQASEQAQALLELAQIKEEIKALQGKKKAQYQREDILLGEEGFRFDIKTGRKE